MKARAVLARQGAPWVAILCVAACGPPDTAAYWTADQSISLIEGEAFRIHPEEEGSFLCFRALIYDSLALRSDGSVTKTGTIRQSCSPIGRTAYPEERVVTIADSGTYVLLRWVDGSDETGLLWRRWIGPDRLVLGPDSYPWDAGQRTYTFEER